MLKIFYKYNQSLIIRFLLVCALVATIFRFSSHFWHHQKSAIIVESPTIGTIFSYLKPSDYNSQTCVVFDIDNTLARPPGHLASDQWFRWRIKQLQDLGMTRQQAVDATMPQLLELMNYIWLEPVEPITAAVINELQNKGVTVIALTARSLDMTYRTIEQLDHIGITFAPKGPRHCPITYGKGKPALYIDGILFSGDYKKSEVITYWFNQINYHPSKVIFVDDDITNVESVRDALKNQTNTYIGIRYSNLDAYVQKFDPALLPYEYALFKEQFPESRPIEAMAHY